MHAAQSINKKSIVTRFLLGNPDSTLRTAMTSLGVLSILFSRIEPLAVSEDDVTGLAHLGCRTLSDALTVCREHTDSGDVIGVIDCLSRAVSSHRIAKGLFLGIVEFGNADVAELARLGVTLAESVLVDLGA